MQPIDATERVREAWLFYDELLDGKIERISQLSGVSKEQFVKINPAEFIEKNQYIEIEDYEYAKIDDFIREKKTPHTYLVSPLDADDETANQISYKERINNKELRASKCKVIQIPSEVARCFFVKNHRQSVPNLRASAVSMGLVYQDKLMGVMTYDKTNGAVRGQKTDYELMRLAFAHGWHIMGGASRLQKHCEEALAELGETEIFSYSNATINEGGVYQALGFEQGKITQGQPFVIMRNNELVRMVSLTPYTSIKSLATNVRFKTHISGNRLWTKMIEEKVKGW